MKKRIKIAGVEFDPLAYNEVLRQIKQFIDKKHKVYITTPNPEIVLNAARDKKFNEVLTNAALAIPDGIGILWAASYLARPLLKWKINRYLQLFLSLAGILFYPSGCRKILPMRVTGTDLLYHVVDYSQQQSWRIFLLGAQPGIAKKAIKKLVKKYPQAKLVGSYAGSPQVSEEEEISTQINNAKPDILFVAYGSPAQEFWIHRNLFKLDAVKVAIGVGGAFDFASNAIKRSPKIMQKFGLEWLWRLMQEPSRIKRIWRATYVFIKLIVKEKYSIKTEQRSNGATEQRSNGATEQRSNGATEQRNDGVTKYKE